MFKNPHKTSISIFLKTIMPVAITVLLFAIAVFQIALPALKARMIESKKELLRELNNTVNSILEDYHGHVVKGEMSKEYAQETVLAIVKDLKYGKEGKDYFWITTTDNMLLMHPYRSDLNGKDVSDFKDPQGTKLFSEFSKIVKRDGEGYYDYLWQWKDDSTKIVPKMSFVKLFEPWQWIIGTGVYLDDLNSEIAAYEEELKYLFEIIFLLIIILSGYVVWQGHRKEVSKKRVESALNETKNMYKELVDNANSIILRMDKVGNITFFNEFAQKFFGFSQDEIMGKNVLGTIVPKKESTTGRDLENMIIDIGKNPDKYLVNENENILKNNKKVWIAWTNKPVFDQEGNVSEVLCVGNDITRRRNAEFEIMAERDKAQRYLETANVIMVSLDCEGKAVLVNKKGCEVVGYEEKELLGKNWFDMFVPQDVIVGVKDYFFKLVRGEVGNIDEYENNLICKNGEERTILWRNTLLKDDSGKIVGTLSSGEDITEKKLVEKDMRILRNDLAFMGRRATMGELSTTLAHELNQPLCAIMNNAQAAKRLLESTDSYDEDLMKDIIGDIITDNARAGYVIHNVREHLKKSKPEFAEIDVSDMIQEVLGIIKSELIAQQIKIEFVPSSESITVWGNKTELQQVILNIVINAKDSMVEGYVSDRNITLDVSDIDETIVISIKDNGPGIQEKEIKSIFEPYYTTKEQGMGMGLSICKSLIEAHRGDLTCNNNDDFGVTFKIYLPKYNEEK